MFLKNRHFLRKFLSLIALTNNVIKHGNSEFLLTRRGFVLLWKFQEERQQCVGTKFLCRYLEMSPLHKQDYRDSHQLISIPCKATGKPRAHLVAKGRWSPLK